MHSSVARAGIQIKVTRLGDKKRIDIEQHYLENRKLGATGIILNNMDSTHTSWWVIHGDEKIAVYMFDEIEPFGSKNFSNSKTP